MLFRSARRYVSNFIHENAPVRVKGLIGHVGALSKACQSQCAVRHDGIVARNAAALEVLAQNLRHIIATMLPAALPASLGQRWRKPPIARPIRAAQITAKATPNGNSIMMRPFNTCHHQPERCDTAGMVQGGCESRIALGAP